MIIKLNDHEIRKILAEHMGKALSVEINPEECWFDDETGTESDVIDCMDISFSSIVVY